jgi:hypothetical protein
MKVVIRWIPQFSRWYISHAASYQNAFGRDVNGFKTRGEAVKFAKENGCEVEKHSYDPLQNYI